MSFPTEPPIRPLANAWRFPRSESHALSSGLPVLVLVDRSVPVVHLRLTSRAGRYLEGLLGEWPAGTASMVSTVSRHGTARYDSQTLAWRQDELGAGLGAGGAMDDLYTNAHALSQHQRQATELLCQLAAWPTFPDEHVARERARSAEGRRHSRSSPDALSNEWLAAALYPGHPYGARLPEPDELAEIQPTHLADFHRRSRGPSNSALVAVGDLDVGALLADAERELAGWGGEPEPLTTVPWAAPPPRVILIDRPGSEQATIAVGAPAFARGDPDTLAAQVMNQILGGGVTSRLFWDLREQRGLTYGCYSSVDVGMHAGDLTVSMSCATDKADEALGALAGHLDRIVQEPPTADELEIAKSYLAGLFPQIGASLAGLGGMVTSRWLFELPEDIWDDHLDRIAAVGADDVLRIARRLLGGPRSLVVVGESDRLEEACASWGEVERYPMDALPGAGPGA